MSQVTVTTGKSKRRRSSTESIVKRMKRKFRSEGSLTVSRNRLSAGFPRQKIVTMTYNTHGGLAAGLGTLVGNTFRANSIYDPDQTSAGHQPSNHDTWALLYNHYTVLTCSIKFNLTWPTVTNAAIPVICGISLNDDTSLASTTDPTTNIENGDPYKIVPSFASGVTTLYRTYNAKQFFGVKSVNEKDSIGAAFGANPADGAFFIPWWGTFDVSASIVPQYWDATLTYRVLLSEPKDIVQS